MTGSLRAYARHRAELGLDGQSLMSVQKAIKTGRITASLSSDGKAVDFEKADALWLANTASKTRTGNHTTRDSGTQETARQRKPLAVRFHIDGQPVDFNTARTATEIARAALLNLELDEQHRKLVELDPINAYVSGMIVKARNELLRIGPELRDRISHESDPIRCDVMITERVERALGVLSEYRA